MMLKVRLLICEGDVLAKNSYFGVDGVTSWRDNYERRMNSESYLYKGPYDHVREEFLLKINSRIPFKFNILMSKQSLAPQGVDSDNQRSMSVYFTE